MGASIKSRLIADVPIANYLSGGLDSSIIAYHLRGEEFTHYCAIKNEEDLRAEGTTSDGAFAKQLADDEAYPAFSPILALDSAVRENMPEVNQLKGHTQSVRSASFSLTGDRIVTASYDNTARVWDTASGEQLAELQGHTAKVSNASFSPDGIRIVTASRDSTARIWDATSGEQLAELQGHKECVISKESSKAKDKRNKY